MSLGKRARPPMKRTTSMTEFTLDLVNGGGGEPHRNNQFNGEFSCSAAASNRRNPADFVETAHFLRVCSLCTRRLIPGRDIYMYRGDRAFCSLECRQHQITQDERREKCSLASKKDVATAAAGETVAVAAAV